MRGPYLQSGTPSSIIVRWRTDVDTDSVVRFGAAPGSLTQTASGSTLTTEHVVSLGGLSSDTRYFYSVGTSSQELAGNTDEYFFVTSPSEGASKATRIWVVGDSGTADANARAVRDGFLAFTGSRTPDLWLMLGDNAYSDGTDDEYQAAVFDMYPRMLRKTVLWPTLGNHDGHTADSASQSGPYYDIFELPTGGSAGGVPSGTEAYYSFDYANIHIVCLNSDDVDRNPSGSMLTWLVSDLQNNDKPWLIAFWHHPPYSKGSHDSDIEGTLADMRENALPILEDYGVDLVLSGHSHSYERSYLIDSHYGTSDTFNDTMKKDPGDGYELGDGAYEKPFVPAVPHDGAVYTVAGSSGRTSGGDLNHPAMVISLNSLGSVVLDIDGGRLDAKFLDESGTVRDDFTILKGPDTQPPVISSVEATGNTEIAVTYNERVESSSATDFNNYAIDNGVGVTSATLSGDGFTVTLATNNLSSGTHTLTVNNVMDLAGNVIAADSQATFEFVETFTTSFQDGVLPDGAYFGTVDTYLAEDEPTSNFGFSSSLSVDGAETQQKDTYALLKWDITTIPNGSVVTAADIVISVTGSSGGPYELYELRRDWVELEATWNDAATGNPWELSGARGPTDRAPAVLGTILDASSGSSYSIPLNADGLALIESWIDDPASNHGIIVANPDTSDGLDFDAREAGTATNRPRLNVTYSSGDTEQPTSPSGLTVTSISASEVGLSWTASTDDTGIAEYRIYQDGLEAGVATGTSSTVTGLTPDTSYGFWVTAVDSAGNESLPSETVTATTDPDTESPTAPGTPTLVSKTDTSVTITWSLSTDNVGVVAYDVYRDGALVGSTSEPDNTFTDNALGPETTYGYSVTARDAAGNVSDPSGTLTVTTDASPDTESPTAPAPPRWSRRRIPALPSRGPCRPITSGWLPTTSTVTAHWWARRPSPTTRSPTTHSAPRRRTATRSPPGMRQGTCRTRAGPSPSRPTRLPTRKVRPLRAPPRWSRRRIPALPSRGPCRPITLGWLPTTSTVTAHWWARRPSPTTRSPTTRSAPRRRTATRSPPGMRQGTCRTRAGPSPSRPTRLPTRKVRPLRAPPRWSRRRTPASPSPGLCRPITSGWSPTTSTVTAHWWARRPSPTTRSPTTRSAPRRRTATRSPPGMQQGTCRTRAGPSPSRPTRPPYRRCT